MALDSIHLSDLMVHGGSQTQWLLLPVCRLQTYDERHCRLPQALQQTEPGAAASPPADRAHLLQLGRQKVCIPLTGFRVNIQTGRKARGDEGEGSNGAWGRMLPPPNWCIYQSQCR